MSRFSAADSLTLNLIVLAGSLAGLCNDAHANVTRAEIAVEIDASFRDIRGQATLEIQNTAAVALSFIELWCFPEVLATPPEGMDEVNEYQFFPHGFDPGGMEVLGAEDASGNPLSVRPRIDREPVVRVDLPKPIEVGDWVSLTIHFRTRIPERFGPFGRVQGQLTLDGGFFPRPPPLGREGFQRDGDPDILQWTLRVSWPGTAPNVLLVNGDARAFAGNFEEVVFKGDKTNRVSLVLIEHPRWSSFTENDARIRFVHRSKRRYERIAHGLEDVSIVDVHGQSLATIASVQSFLSRRDLRAEIGDVLLVEAPLRRELSGSAPGMVYVSDRIFEVTPVERLRRFHRLPLASSYIETALTPVIGPREPVERRHQVIGLAASALTLAWERGVYGRREDARDVLGDGDFVVAVDDMLRAPQIPFEGAYFRDSVAIDRQRFHRFSHARPLGAFWYIKLFDRIGEEALNRVVDAVLYEGLPFDKAISRHAPDLDSAYLANWDAGMPRLNYGIGVVRAGKDEQGSFFDIEILRQGDTPPGFSEYVEVVASGKGRPGAVRKRTVVSGPVETVRFRGFQEVPHVVIDPGRRIQEFDLERSIAPRFDNTNIHPWRLLLDGFFFNLDSASQRLDLAVSAYLRRDDDLSNLFVLRAGDFARSLGVGGAWSYSYGPKVRENQLRYSVGTGLSVTWLKPVLGEKSGLNLLCGFTLADFTYESATDPRAGGWLTLEGGPALALIDNEVRLSGYLEAKIARVLDLGSGHALAGRLKLSSLFGDLPATQRWPVGGLGAVRAFGAFLDSGRHRALGSLEWRHRFTRDLSIDVLRLFWVYGLDGVLFADAALIAEDTLDFGKAESVFVGVGYGLRVHFLLGGFHPMVLTVDLGVPLLEGGALGPRHAAPVGLSIALGQVF